MSKLFLKDLASVYVGQMNRLKSEEKVLRKVVEKSFHHCLPSRLAQQVVFRVIFPRNVHFLKVLGIPGVAKYMTS